MKWLADHPPTGLGQMSGQQMSMLNGEVVTLGTSFVSTVHHPALSYAGVAINTLALTPSTTLLRVDAVAEWVDPHPVNDTADGRRITLTVGGACPKSDEGIAGVDGAGAPTVSLLPRGTIDGGLVCSYYGGNTNAYRLAGSARLDARAARRLGAGIAAVSLSMSRSIRTCPGGSGGVDLIALHYADGRTADLFVTTDGCTDVSNGRIVAESIDLDALGLAATAH